MAFKRRRASGDAPAGSQYVGDADDFNEDEEDAAEEETPRRSRRAGRDSSRPAGRRDSEDGSRPAGRRNKAPKKASGGGGWNALANAKSDGYAENLKVGTDDMIIKFLEPEPYKVYRQHWLQEIKAARKSYTCLEDGCPLCDEVGDRPQHRILFNVVDLSDPEKPSVKTWSMGKRLAEKIHGLSQKARTSPIDREDLYWAVSKSGTGTATEYNLQPVKAGDLAEWFDEEADVQPLDAEELAELETKMASADDVHVDSLETLEKLVDEL